MPNGRPGDHPIYDIVHHGLVVFGPEIDNRVRAVDRVGDQHFRRLLAAIVTGWPRKRGDLVEPSRLVDVLDSLLDCAQAAREKGG